MKDDPSPPLETVPGYSGKSFTVQVHFTSDPRLDNYLGIKLSDVQQIDIMQNVSFKRNFGQVIKSHSYSIPRTVILEV